MKSINKFLTLLFILSLISCGIKGVNKESSSNEDVQLITEVVGALNSTPNEVSEDQVSLKSSTMSAGETCEQARVQICQEGVKQAIYDHCTYYVDWFNIEKQADVVGQIDLNYSDSSCSLDLAGQSVTRTFELTFLFDENKKTLIVNSDMREIEDYSQTGVLLEIGGGGKVLRKSDGWTAEILGRHSQIKDGQGNEVANFSIRTNPEKPIEITGSLSIANRLVTSGEIEVYHNRAKAVSRFEAENIQWTSQCCYPISGKLHVNSSMSSILKRNASDIDQVEFLACGEAQLTKKDGSVEKVSLEYCN